MVDAVCNKEVVHIKMSCALGTQQSAILFKEDCALVVLMKDGHIETETLSIEKIVHPK